MGIFSKLISKDDEETEEEKKKRKEEEEDIVHVKVGGEEIPIAKGDMSNDEWNAIVKAAKGDNKSASGDSIVVKGDDGSDLVIPKGDIDDDAWEQIKKNADKRGSLVRGDQRDQVRASDIEALPARRGGDVGRTYSTDREEEESPRGRVEIGEPEIEKPRYPRGRVEIGEAEFRDADFGPTRKEYKDHNIAVRMAEDMILNAGERPKRELTDVMHPPLSEREKYVQRKISEYEEEVGKPTSADIQRFYDKYDKREGAKKSKEESFKKSVRDEEASIQGEGRPRNPAVRMAQEMALGATSSDQFPDRKGDDVGEVQELTPVQRARQAGIEYGPAIKEGLKNSPIGQAYDFGSKVVDGAKMLGSAIPQAVESAGAFAQGVMDPAGAAATNSPQPFVGPPPELAGKGTMPGEPPVAGAPAAQSPTSMSGSTSVSARSRPGMAEIPMPKDRSGEIDSAYSDAQKAMRANVDLEAQGLKAKSQAFDAQVNEGIRQKAKLADIEVRKQKEVEKPMRIYNGFMSELLQPSEKIDPNRWVNSRSTGQKVLLVLGAMFTKGGNVDMIRKAIDADIDAQKSDIAANRDRVKTGLQASQNLVQMARDQGADEYQAAKIAYAVECDIVANRLQMIVANTDSQTVRQKAEQAIAEMNVQKSKALTDMDRYSTDLAIRKAHVQNEYEDVQIKRAEAWRKANAPPKPGKGPEKIKGAQLEHIANLQTQLKELGKLRADYVSKYGEGGYGSAAYSAVTGLAPTSDAARFNRKGKSIQLSVLAAAQSAGVIQPGEYKRFEKEIASASSPDALNQLDTFIDQISTRLDTTLKVFEAGGYNTKGQFSGAAPETFEADEEEESEE